MNRFFMLLGCMALTAFVAVGCPADGDTVTNYYGTSSSSSGGGVSHDERFPLVSGVLRLIQGNIESTISLQSDYEYLIRGTVFVNDGATLVIPPGTKIYGESATVGTLVVEQGGKIYAVGTREDPIVFTSEAAAGSRAPGDWGGIILNGKAKINVQDGGGGVAQGEGNTGAYGGGDDNDNSGVLRYVVVQFAGKLYSPDNELNGIAFQAVGDSTVVEYCMVSRNADDAFEWFGGTVNCRYIVAFACEDDHIDWTHGARFRLQYALVDQNGASDPDRGIEADNYEFGEDNTPRSHPVLSNVTFYGYKGTSTGREAMVLRRGTEAQIYNCIIDNFPVGLEIDSSSTVDNADTGGGTVATWDSDKLTLEGCLFANCDSDAKGDGHASVAWDDTDLATVASNNTQTTDAIDTVGADKYETTATWALNATNVVDPRNNALAATTPDEWFEKPDFIGGISPDYNWLEGWTDFSTS